MISSSNNNNSSSANSSGHGSSISSSGGGGTAAGAGHVQIVDSNTMRNICNFLQQPMGASTGSTALSGSANPYDHIIEMIRGLDLQDDGIMMNHKIKSIATDFCSIVRDEHMLCESMEYINDKALADGETALKFALLFSSRNFDALAMKDTKVRSAMLKILETNFLNADNYRLNDRERFYNSITLLGEYYHRVRLADNSPITILGESLLGLLLREINQLGHIDVKLGKLILSQITLNGDIMRARHETELKQLLFHIRRNLIEQPALKPAVKALLLMTLDLHYSKFANLGPELEAMYTKYLVQEDEDEGNNNNGFAQPVQAMQLPAGQQQFIIQPTFADQQLAYATPIVNSHAPQMLPHGQQQVMYDSYEQQQQEATSNTDLPSAEQSNSQSAVNDNGSAANDSFELQPSTKKWSEQVCEDSFYDSEIYNGALNTSSDTGVQDQLNSSYGEQREQLHSSSSRCDNERDSTSRSSRRSQQQHNSPRSQKQNYKNNIDRNISSQNSQHSGGEERDETKPLPRWRTPRFNRDSSDQHHGDGRPNNHRRYSTSFDEDGHSVRSEGGSIRLYSINDRLKHSQEKISSIGNSNNYNAVANWDRQSQRDDRSERSYMSNYERGNQRHRGGRHHYNNRQNYDKPPRFQKNQQQHHKDSWRRSHHASNNSSKDEENSFPPNGPESNSRSSSRARTLPRPAKSNMDGGSADVTAAINTYRRSQSPTHNYRGGGGQNRYRSFNARYSSQSSLASEASSTLDRRQQPSTQHPHQRNRNFVRKPTQQRQQEDWQDTHSVHGQPEEASWSAKDNNSELVRNARHTTKYMNYLSSKK